MTRDNVRQKLAEALATRGVVSAGRRDDTHRWSATDLATDLADAVLAMIGDWQPIESAPRDGTWFLACKAGVMTIGKMGIRTMRGGSDGKGGLKEWTEECFIMKPSNLSWNPTHWRPLPPPPEAK